jgi:hypothetical protein
MSVQNYIPAISGQDETGLAIRTEFPLLVSILVTLKGPVSNAFIKINIII